MPGPQIGRGPLWDWVGLDLLTQQLQNTELVMRQQMKGIERKLDLLLQGQATGKDMLMAEKEEIQNLIQQVQNNKNAVESAKLALGDYMAKIEELTKDLNDAIANSTDVSPDIKAAADELLQNTRDLTAAIPLVAQAVGAGTK